LFVSSVKFLHIVYKYFMINFLEYLQSVGGFGITHGWEPPVIAQGGKPGEAKSEVERNQLYFDKAAKSVVIPKLYKVLGRDSTFPIHIYFGKHSKVNIDKHSDNQEYFFEELGISYEDIVYVKLEVGGDVWKPWMVLHGLGHAIFEKKPKERRKIPYSREDIINTINHMYVNEYSILSQAEKHSWIKDNPLSYFITDRYSQIRNICFTPIFTFRSVRSGLAPSPTFSPTTAVNEFVYELIPWFFFNGGKIPLPNDLIYKNIADTVEKSKKSVEKSEEVDTVEKSEEHIRRVTVEMLKKVEFMLIENLEACRGHVLIDAEV